MCFFDGGECGRDFEFVPGKQGFGGLNVHVVLRRECVFGGVTRKLYPRNRGTGVEIAKSHRPDEINRLNAKTIGVTQFCDPHQHLQILAHAERAIASPDAAGAFARTGLGVSSFGMLTTSLGLFDRLRGPDQVDDGDRIR